MAAPPPVLGTVLGLLLAERAAELAIARRNDAWLRAHGAVFAPGDGLSLIVAAQVALIGGLAVEGALAPWAAVDALTWAGLAVAVGAQGLRYWVIATLGSRWSIRVATLPGAQRVTRGPYRFLRHPNYVAVAAEAVALPLAFHAWATLLVALPLLLVALARRIVREERALAERYPQSAPRLDHPPR
jgi:methyltransferase